MEDLQRKALRMQVTALITLFYRDRFIEELRELGREMAECSEGWTMYDLPPKRKEETENG